jgi:hypothetical protein
VGVDDGAGAGGFEDGAVDGFACADRSEASRFEHLIKQLSATDKRRLCDPQQRATLLAESAPPLRALQFACGAATGAACDATGISPRSNFVET